MAASVAGESHYVWLEEVATAYFVIVMRARSRAHTSRAELFSPHLLVLWPFSSHYVCFQLSAYTLELIYTFKAFVEVPTYSFSFFPPSSFLSSVTPAGGSLSKWNCDVMLLYFWLCFISKLNRDLKNGRGWVWSLKKKSAGGVCM